MLQLGEIERMSLEERLQAMELLWTSISRDPHGVPSPAWHEEVLTTRLANVERGESEFLSVAELKERLQKPPA
jgi:putative addiction module component (TIGR02574 family)